MTTFFNFGLKIKSAWDARVVKPILGNLKFQRQMLASTKELLNLRFTGCLSHEF